MAMSITDIANSIFLRRINSEEAARKGARQGVIAAVVVAIYAFVTFVLALEAENLVDCLLFIIVAWRIRRMSRIWALLGLLLYLVEVTFVVTKFPSILTAALFVVAVPFGNAVRATIAYARERRLKIASQRPPWQSASGMGTINRIAVSLLVIGAMGLGVYLEHLLSAPSSPTKTVDSVEVLDRDACLKQTFWQFSDPKLIATVSETKLGQLRILSAKMYCARQWDAGKFAAGASLLESNGLLITQMMPRSQVGPNPDLLYKPFPADVANFLKVFDSGVLLKNSIEDIEKRRTTDPTIPSLDVIRNVRSQLQIDTPWTMPSPLPQAYAVAVKPQITLITTVGLTMSLWQLWSYTQNDVFSGGPERTIIAKMTGLPDDENTNFYADFILKSLRLDLSWGSDLRSRLRADSSDPLPRLSILFLPRKMLVNLPPERPAAYVEHQILVALTSETAPIAPNSSETLDLHVFASHSLPMPLNHEFHHYLFYRKAVASSGFILEGEATANGEYMSQMIREGAFADPTNKKDVLEQMTLRLFKAANASPSGIGPLINNLPDFDWRLYNELGLARERSAPMTAVQCRLLDVLHESYSGTKSPLPLATQLTLDPKQFQAQSDLELAYAEAWAVYHVDSVQQRGWHETLEHLLPAIQRGGIGSLTASDRQDLARISQATLDWVSHAFVLTQPGCTSLPHASSISANVD